MIELVKRARKFEDRIAVISNGTSFTYGSLSNRSDAIASHLLQERADLQEGRIAIMIDPSFAYAATQWGIWKAGGITVPLCTLHPLPSIEYVLLDTGCRIIVIEKRFHAFLTPLADKHQLTVIIYDEIADRYDSVLPEVDESRRAMILFTSGTTSQPKGVVTTHSNIRSQIKTLVDAWQWSREDHILNILPLHHVHGIINVMSCALWSGACCEFLPKFDAQKVWESLSKGRVNLFMAVPTIYFKLIHHWESQDHTTRKIWSEACISFRLMVSGSAALPISILDQWEEITGQRLLERYGMTEIGMGLSNPYNGERRAGHVGQPLSNVQIRLADESGEEIDLNHSGEIQIKGPGVFLEYWQKPKATQEAFTEDGWFRTGDVAILSDGYYKILGRTSVDIIKSGGYKISALEIEEVIRNYPGILDCGIIGLPDDEWGEVVSAALVIDKEKFDISALKRWLKSQLAGYRIPRKYITLDDLPRNTLGKVTKNELKKLF